MLPFPKPKVNVVLTGNRFLLLCLLVIRPHSCNGVIINMGVLPQQKHLGLGAVRCS
jgi:hypothetical protein